MIETASLCVPLRETKRRQEKSEIGTHPSTLPYAQL
jgi:hypothetical protein